MKCKSEVFGTLLTEYDERNHMRLERKAERAEGRREGLAEGLSQGREEGREQGVDRVNALIVKLTEQKRTDDIIKAAKDKEYQERLFKEFGL